MLSVCLKVELTSFISDIKSFLACGWTIVYHVITRRTSYPRKPGIVDFESCLLTGYDDVIRR